MPPPRLAVGFTGHRKLTDPGRIETGIRQALRSLQRQAGRPLEAVSSAASGADTLFIEAVLGLEIPWTLLLPFPAEEFRLDFEPGAWQRVERLLPRAVRTEIEPPAASRDEAYWRCGKRGVDLSEVLLAVWNGRPAAGRGGTADIVDYARSRAKPIIRIDADSGKTAREG
jgi:hypothetical protein